MVSLCGCASRCGGRHSAARVPRARGKCTVVDGAGPCGIRTRLPPPQSSLLARSPAAGEDISGSRSGSKRQSQAILSLCVRCYVYERQWRCWMVGEYQLSHRRETGPTGGFTIQRGLVIFNHAYRHQPRSFHWTINNKEYHPPTIQRRIDIMRAQLVHRVTIL